MDLKFTVDTILKEKKRPFSWLAEQMGWTFDGLKLSLTSESIKYRDIIIMATLLEIEPALLFKPSSALLPELEGESATEVLPAGQGALKQALKSCKELNVALKDQIKDKDRIITLMSGG